MPSTSFGVEVSERICLDVGASTGGFTDCLLQRGASRVYAVDVGTGQLDQRLRRDERVVVMEKSNAHARSPNLRRPAVTGRHRRVLHLLEKVLPAAMNVLESAGEAVALVKPQFEVGRSAVGKGGVVRSPSTGLSWLGWHATRSYEAGTCWVSPPRRSAAPRATGSSFCTCPAGAGRQSISRR